MSSDGDPVRPHSPMKAPILKSETSLSVKCRFCNTTIPTGGAVYTITTVPPSLEYVFRGGIFCSEKCIRGFCLESLEILDTLATLSPKAMVTDLHEPRLGATQTLVSVLGG